MLRLNTSRISRMVQRFALNDRGFDIVERNRLTARSEEAAPSPGKILPKEIKIEFTCLREARATGQRQEQPQKCADAIPGRSAVEKRFDEHHGAYNRHR